VDRLTHGAGGALRRLRARPLLPMLRAWALQCPWPLRCVRYGGMCSLHKAIAHAPKQGAASLSLGWELKGSGIAILRL
jgi:hypothetical protein